MANCMYVCWMLLDKWIQVETGWTRADPETDRFPGYMLRNANVKGQPCICVDGMPLACQVRLCTLFGAPLTWVQAWVWICLGGFLGWTNPGMVNEYVRLGFSGEPSLSSGSRLRPHPFRSLGKSDLSGLRQGEDWLDSAWEVAWRVCLNPSRMTGLSSCPAGLDPEPGVTPYESLGW